MTPAIEHVLSYAHDHRKGGNCRHRTRCACGWWSDSYAAASDAQRAGEVHVRRARREDFDGLIAKSSIGIALDDIKKRGIDAHLIDLEREMNRRRRGRKKPTRAVRR